MSRVLIVDDDGMFAEMLAQCIRRLGHEVSCFPNLREGLKAVRAGNCDVVYLDVNLPDGDGLEAIPGIYKPALHPEVIIITGSSSELGAELAIRNGAWDYIEKTASNDAKILPLVRALQYREQKCGGSRKRTLDRQGLIGGSPQMNACFDHLAEAADSEAPVLITGETGTGKECFAHAIHLNSARSGRHFVVVDCAALPETLVASLLFGHRKGAFTGADQDREGLIKQADGGTLFLDEIGEMPLTLQKSFLRVLQDHTFRPLGSQREEKSDFRLVAATNRNLDRMVEEGDFRSDLLFRLRSLHIELPPLRSRPSDIKELTLNYLVRICEKNGVGIKGLAPEFLEALVSYAWPGNVRELINTLEKSVSAARFDQMLFPAHLPVQLRVKFVQNALSAHQPEEETPDGAVCASGELPGWAEYHKTMLEDGERRYLKELIRLAGGNMDTACAISGLSQSRLYGILKKFDLEIKNSRPSRTMEQNAMGSGLH